MRDVKLGRRGAHDVVRVERAARCPTAVSASACGGSGCRGPFGIFLDRIDVDGEDTRAVVREERGERAADDLRSAGVCKGGGGGERWGRTC